MSYYIRPFIGLALIIVLTLPALADNPEVSPTNEKLNPWVEHWLKRKWEFRYWIKFAGGEWNGMQRSATRRNKAKENAPSQNELEIFSENEVLKSSLSLWTFGEKEISNVVPIEFSEDGKVIEPLQSVRPLRGQLASIGRSFSLMLSEGKLRRDRQYELSEWFHGFGDSSIDWAPTFCSGDEMAGTSPSTDEFYKYGPKFNPNNPVKPIFGCREWAYQLYDDARPYIDVTSYTLKTKTHPHGTYIREFIGWARFGDKKPVIGKDANTWYCLYDCPNNEEPGHIADIHIWTGRFGWSIPKAPSKAPTFPDPPAKQGNYPKPSVIIDGTMQ